MLSNLGKKKWSLLLLGFLSFCLSFVFSYFLFIDSGENQKTIAEHKKNKTTEKKKESFVEISSFISPHHLVAENLIERIFKKVGEINSGERIDQVVLVSPNHLNLGSGKVVFYGSDWKINGGKILETNLGLIEKMEKRGFGHREDSAFANEHGIKNLLPFMKKHFPNAEVVSMMVRDNVNSEEVEELAFFLDKNISQNSLVILSSDFSHYLDSSISEFHDGKAMSVIENFNYEQVYNLETDCLPGLYFAMKFSEFRGCSEFNLIENSNSSEIYQNDFVGENTSYVTGYFSKNRSESRKSSKQLNLLFLGDLMLDRNNRLIIEKKGAEFSTEKINRLFWGQDLNIVNLEGPITSNSSISVGTGTREPAHFKFTFDEKQTVDFLKYNRINIVNLGNNHTLNFGKNGLLETKNILRKNEVDFFGDSYMSDSDSLITKTINDRNVVFISHNWFGGLELEEIEVLIKRLSAQDYFVVIYAHWGTEYQLKASERQVSEARKMIDVGADLVIGSHPHVIQPIEIYKNKVIFYSLGNFFFDQYFSENTKTMLAVGAEISNEEINFYLTPLYQNTDGSIVLADQEKKKVLYERLSATSTVSNSIKKEIKKGTFSLKIN